MIEKRYVLKKSIKKIINKLMIMTIIVLSGMILVKINPELKEQIKRIVYDNNFKLIENKKLYEKYFGDILSKKYSNNNEMVSMEKLNYKKYEKYKEGVKLTVTNNYSVPVLESGVITYINNDTILIEQVNGIKVSYSNISLSNIKLYDYLEKGSILGEVKGNELYLKFQKDGKYLDYKKYI